MARFLASASEAPPITLGRCHPERQGATVSRIGKRLRRGLGRACRVGLVALNELGSSRAAVAWCLGSLGSMDNSFFQGHNPDFYEASEPQTNSLICCGPGSGFVALLMWTYQLAEPVLESPPARDGIQVSSAEGLVATWGRGLEVPSEGSIRVDSTAPVVTSSGKLTRPW